MFSGFTATIGAHSIFEEVAGFSPLWFPRGKLFVSLVIIVVHAIILDKILRSYCLNDKNITLKTHIGAKRTYNTSLLDMCHFSCFFYMLRKLSINSWSMSCNL